MPELPEVETVARDLVAARIAGRRVAETRVWWPRTLANSRPSSFDRALNGRQIVHIGRRGKYLVFSLADDLIMLAHLRMTGRLRLFEAWPNPPGHARLAWRLDDGRILAFSDARKFGRIWLLAADAPSPLDALGPEPMDNTFTADTLAQALRGRSLPIKPALLDQRIVAGLGNIYADEALWLARLHPLRRANSLSHDDCRLLRNAIRQVLRKALAGGGTSLGTGQGNFYGLQGQPGRNLPRLNVYRRTDQPCRRCHAPVRRMVLAQRSAHFCPCCQPEGKPGAVTPRSKPRR